MDASKKSINAGSTTAHCAPNFKILLPWVTEIEAAMARLPSS